MEREVSEVDRKLLLKKTYLDRIHYYLTRNPIDQEELYSLIRKFFSEYLKLDYEFTYEELSQELNKVFIKPKVKEHIDTFLIRLSESEYLEENALGTVEINGYLRELDDIIRNVIFDDQPVHEESSTLMQKVLNIKHKGPEKVLDISDVSMLIDEINFHITNGNLDIAKNSYVELLKSYDKLNKDDKKKLHDDMNEVYERLQTLIKNPKSSAAAGIAGVGSASASGSMGSAKQNVSEYVKKVVDLAEETIFYINASNLDSAKKSYSQTLQAYESLNPEEKKLMHLRVNDLYNQLQTLSMRPKSINAEPRLATKGLSNIVDSIPEDLPALEPLSESGLSAAASASPSISSTSPASTSSSASTASTISTASFVEEFGKSAANKPELSNASFFINAENVSTTSNVANVSSPSVASNSTNSASNVGSNSTIASALSSSNINQDFDISRESFAEEIDSDRLATTSGAENMLFTAAASSDNIEKESKKTVAAATKSAVKQEPVSAPKPALASVSAPISSIKSIATQAKVVRLEPRPVVQPLVQPKIQFTIQPTVKSTQPTTELNVKAVERPEPKDVDAITSELTHPSTVEKSVAARQIIPSQIDKLNVLLKRIDDDIVMEKFDKAKETYKEALLIYRPLRDSEKSRCYERFYATFKGLDDALHQKSLHELLDKHLSESTQSHRPLASRKSDISDNKSEPYVSESSKIINTTTLPIILTNDLETTRVYELIEESYFNIDNSHSDLAMLKYFKALEFYHKLPVNDKKKLYSDLYGLFKKLSTVKKVQV